MPFGFKVEGLIAPTPCEVHPVEGCTRPEVARLRAQLRRKCVLNNDETPVFREASQRFHKFIKSYVDLALAGRPVEIASDEFEASFGEGSSYSFPSCVSYVQSMRNSKSALNTLGPKTFA